MDKIEWIEQQNQLSTEQQLADLKVQFTELKSDVKEIKELLTQGKGAVKILQLLFYIGGPIVMAIYWIKDHMK